MAVNEVADFDTASITLKDLAKSFGELEAVKALNLVVDEGSLVCLLGPSGCGKTTTLRMIAGFEEPTGGQVMIGQEDVTHVPPYDRPTAMVFQSYALFPHMSVYENIAYGLRARRASRDEIDRRVSEAVRLMELNGQEDKSPPQLSGGQQQRVALACALVIRPKVLLFDEPLSNLDAQLRVRMRSEIRDIQRRLGISSLYVTHDQEEAFSISDRVAVMNKGELVQYGTPRELYIQPADRFVAQFVGLSNIVPVEILDTRSDGSTVQVFGFPVSSRVPPSSPSGDAAIVLRPEALEIRPQGASGVPARVRSSAYVGPIIRYRVVVEQDGTELIIDLANPSSESFYEVGAEVSIKLPDEVPSLLI